MLSWELKETLENQPLNFAHDETEAERCQGIIQGHIAGTDGFFAFFPSSKWCPSFAILDGCLSVALASFLILNWAFAGFILALPRFCGTL